MLDSWDREQRDVHRLNIWRAIHAAARGRYRLDCPEEFAAWGCIDGDERKFEIPFTDVGMQAKRDLQGGGAGSAGGFLVDEQVRPLAMPLSGSGVGQAGATFIENATRNQKIPALGASPNFEWLANESASLTPDTSMTLVARGATFNVGGISVKASYALQQQTNLDRMMPQLLIELGNTALDRAALNGSGTSGEPLGLLQNSEVPSVSGATANMPALSEMEELAVQNGASDENLSWMAAPNVRRILRPRLLTGGGVSLWPESTLLGHRALVTPQMPPGSLLVGDFANLTIVLFGEGFEILLDPYTAFRSGAVTFQLRLAVGVVVNYPAAFRKSTVT
jgi:HK97 family phage major capsid protein